MPDLSETEIQAIGDRARRHNAAIGVSGRLLFIDDRFFQVIEGPATAIGALYAAIQADPRHGSVKTLLDRQTDQRLFEGWAMDALTLDSISDGERDRLAGIARALSSGELNPDSAGMNVLELIVGTSAPLIRDQVRPAPRQTRAIQTVDRLLNAARALVVRQGTTDISIDVVAKEAGVSVPTAYRYFATPLSLLRAAMRQLQLRRLDDFRNFIATETFVSRADMADKVAAYSARTYMAVHKLPVKLALHGMRHYHDLAYDECWDIALELQAAMRRSNLPTGEHEERAALAAGLAAIAAACKVVALKDYPTLRSEPFARTLGGIMAGAMDSQPGKPN